MACIKNRPLPSNTCDHYGDCGWKTDSLLSKNEDISFTKKIFHDSITALVLLMFTSTLNVKFNFFFWVGEGGVFEILF